MYCDKFKLETCNNMTVFFSETYSNISAIYFALYANAFHFSSPLRIKSPKNECFQFPLKRIPKWKRFNSNRTLCAVRILTAFTTQLFSYKQNYCQICSSSNPQRNSKFTVFSNSSDIKKTRTSTALTKSLHSFGFISVLL